MSPLAGSLAWWHIFSFWFWWILGQECLGLAHMLRAELAVAFKLLLGLVGLLLALRRHVVVVRHLVFCVRGCSGDLAIP